MRKCLYIEVRAQLAIEPYKQIQIEIRGDARGIVVCGQQDLWILAHVYADQERGCGAEGITRALKETLRLRGIQITDG